QINQYLSRTFGILTEKEYLYSAATKMATQNSDDLAENMRGVSSMAIHQAQATSQVATSFLNQGSAAQLSAQQLGDLQGAWAGLQQAQQTFNQSFGSQVVAKLEQAGVKGADFEAALGAIDGQLGTNYLAQKN